MNSWRSTIRLCRWIQWKRVTSNQKLEAIVQLKDNRLRCRSRYIGIYRMFHGIGLLCLPYAINCSDMQSHRLLWSSCPHEPFIFTKTYHYKLNEKKNVVVTVGLRVKQCEIDCSDQLQKMTEFCFKLIWNFFLLKRCWLNFKLS